MSQIDDYKRILQKLAAAASRTFESPPELENPHWDRLAKVIFAMSNAPTDLSGPSISNLRAFEHLSSDLICFSGVDVEESSPPTWLGQQLNLFAGSAAVFPEGSREKEADRIKELESELRFKETQLISARREAIIARREAEHFKSENTSIVSNLAGLSAALRNISHVVTGQKAGEPLLHECHKGVVIDVAGDEAAIRFAIGDGFIEQTFAKSQFLNQKLPNIGDVVEACVVILKKARDDSDTREGLPNDFGSFQQRGTKGPFSI
jgi:hypothetical protein